MAVTQGHPSPEGRRDGDEVDELLILSTRPLETLWKQQAAAKGVIVEESSFIQTEALFSDALRQKVSLLACETCTVIFTSMTAVDAVTALLGDKIPVWNIFCMGNTTRQKVEDFFSKKSIVATGSNALELATQVIEYNRERIIEKAVFFCGNQRRNELPDALLQNDIPLEEITVYETLETTHLLLKSYDGILFFSPSAVHSFFSKNSIEQKTVLFAIGNTTAEAIANYTSNEIVIGQSPSKEGLLKEAVDFF